MRRLGFIGAGNMAEALARGLLARRMFAPSAMAASDVDGARRRKFTRTLKIKTTPDNDEVVQKSDAIVLAVKPQNIDEVMTEVGNRLRRHNSSSVRAPKPPLFISIVAGVPISRLEQNLGFRARIIRVMPNAPAMVGKGMAVLVRGGVATKSDEAFALRLFAAVGEALAVNDEALLDAVTALSGSGPAYVYLFVKALSEAGIAEGLAPAMATRMAIQTVAGAIENMLQSKMSAAELIRIVASPGGTTEAALRKFAEQGFADVVGNAVAAAAARSRELGRAS